MCVENTDDLKEARTLSKELNEDIEFRVRIYCACLGNVTKNYRTWLIEDYQLKLTLEIGKQNRIKIMNKVMNKILPTITIIITTLLIMNQLIVSIHPCLLLFLLSNAIRTMET